MCCVLSGVQKLISVTLIPAFFLVLTPVGTVLLLSILVNGFSLIDTMFHEIGHTIFAWAFGYPSLPSFDLQHGGGMSYYFKRQWMIQITGFAGAAYLCYLAHQRSNLLFGIMLTISVAYFLSAMTEFHQAIIDFMGHGFSILTGSFFILRSLMGWTEKRRGEKWISAFLGYFIIFVNIKLIWKLIFDIDYQEEYWNQKGSHGFGDFSKIADYFWFKNEEPVAWFCLALCVLFLILPHAAYWHFKNLPDRPASYH
ncbi:MAG: hypothetical protein DI586_09090 [Micavibrio aeruginosavorus]|uniref:Uncharacterized protein n=1 Tax=Micavibrio aeruginosavorus TaxID=349221 RepID=A0A2W5HGI2_9BACT|nr:MAG: hypothetical protein DI586_09090 [Micavibrio aeruginosavorus]